MDKIEYDLVIAGGGLVGLSTAIALTAMSKRDNGRQLRIALIESQAPKEQQNTFDEPGSMALSWGTRLIYESLDIWKHVKNHAESIKLVDISDKEGDGTVHIACSDYSVPALGYVVPNQTLLNTLSKVAEQQELVTLYRPATIENITFELKQPNVTIIHEDKEKILSCELLVFASGASTQFISQMGFVQNVKDYKHSAFLATVQHEQAHNCVAYERFTAEGPMALLPMPGENQKTSSLIWTMSPSISKERLQLVEQDLLDELNQRFDYPIGSFQRIGKFKRYQMQLKLVPCPVREGVVLLGNSAHLLHPVAAQGYNLSIRDVFVLSKIIGLSPPDTSIGSLALLNDYVNRQAKDQATAATFSDQLVKLFSLSQNKATIFGRNKGLKLFDKLKPVKRWFSHKTMGVGGFGK